MHSGWRQHQQTHWAESGNCEFLSSFHFHSFWHCLWREKCACECNVFIQTNYIEVNVIMKLSIMLKDTTVLQQICDPIHSPFSGSPLPAYEPSKFLTSILFPVNFTPISVPIMIAVKWSVQMGKWQKKQNSLALLWWTQSTVYFTGVNGQVQPIIIYSPQYHSNPVQISFFYTTQTIYFEKKKKHSTQMTFTLWKKKKSKYLILCSIKES